MKNSVWSDVCGFISKMKSLGEDMGHFDDKVKGAIMRRRLLRRQHLTFFLSRISLLLRGWVKSC